MTIYDRISSIYDWLILSERPYRERALQMLAAQPGERFLEIGCGTGQTLLELAAAVGETGHVLGIDLSPGMLKQSQKKLGGYAPISLLLGSGLELPLEAASCDALFLSFTLELFDLEDQHSLLAGARRVLKESGRLGLVTLSTHRQTIPLSIYYSLHEAFPQIIDCRPIDPVPLLAAAGFTVTFREDDAMFGLPLSILLAVKESYS
jgi:ubiquinone/menaquinone biosynthesis C-methylase UbiE